MLSHEPSSDSGEAHGCQESRAEVRLNDGLCVTFVVLWSEEVWKLPIELISLCLTDHCAVVFRRACPHFERVDTLFLALGVEVADKARVLIVNAAQH